MKLFKTGIDELDQMIQGGLVWFGNGCSRESPRESTNIQKERFFMNWKMEHDLCEGEDES
jgi:hypothetical protein